jgi:hypothetical protein
MQHEKNYQHRPKGRAAARPTDVSAAAEPSAGVELSGHDAGAGPPGFPQPLVIAIGYDRGLGSTRSFPHEEFLKPGGVELSAHGAG